MASTQELLNQLILERGRRCELCGDYHQVYDPDHAIYPKTVYRGLKIPEMDKPYNLILLGRECHENKMPNYRQWAWEQNCVRYGRDAMNEWRDNLPLKIKTL